MSGLLESSPLFPMKGYLMFSDEWMDDDDLVEEDIADDYLGNDLDGDCRADCGHVSMRDLIEFGCSVCEEEEDELCD
jgi:hypothetical protein